MEFEWDENKATANQNKRGSPDEACGIWDSWLRYSRILQSHNS
jgi:uncharacterized DUF497 family protein